ncbi:MAG: chemotaxis protein CheW [Candidatus Goldiibacteriota bacterium]
MDGNKRQNKSLGEMLVESGRVSKYELEEALKEQEKSKEPLGKILVKNGIVAEADIVSVLNGLQTVVVEINNELFGLEVVSVNEILKYKKITSVPSMPDFILGMLSVRQEVIPVISISRKIFDVAEEVTDETRIIIVEIKDNKTGILVDRVHAVKNFGSSCFENSGKYSLKVREKYVAGVIRDGEKLITLLKSDVLTEGR